MAKKEKHGKVVIHKKTSPDSHEFRQVESKRSLDYYCKNKTKKAQASQDNASDKVLDITEDMDEDHLEITDPNKRSKELSHKRYLLRIKMQV